MMAVTTSRSEWWPVELAVLASLLLHAAALTVYQYRDRLPVTRALRSLLAAPMRVAPTTPTTHGAQPVIQFVPAETAPASAAERAPTHRPHIFVETDERQPAAAESPRDTPFYSDRATVAANPENPTGLEGNMPYIPGTDDRVWSTEDVSLARPGQTIVVPPQSGGAAGTPAVSTPAVSPTVPPPASLPVESAAAQPLADRGNEAARLAEVTRIVEERRIGQEQKRDQVRQLARMGPVAEPVPKSADADESVGREGMVAVSPPAGSPDGRALAARKSRLVAAGVSRQGVAAFNVAASPFGPYDKRLIQAVQSRWYALIERYGLYERAGQVTVRFELWEDGRVANLERKTNTAGELLALICEKAITDSAPFDPLPESLRVLLAGEPREVNFTFYY